MAQSLRRCMPLALFLVLSFALPLGVGGCLPGIDLSPAAGEDPAVATGDDGAVGDAAGEAAAGEGALSGEDEADAGSGADAGGSGESSEAFDDPQPYEGPPEVYGWAYAFEAGQSFSYRFHDVNEEFGVDDRSTLSMSFSDAGDGLLRLDYSGAYAENAFEGSTTGYPETILYGVEDPWAAMVFIGLATGDYALINPAEWKVGAQFTDPTGFLTVTITGTESYAGLTGYVCACRNNDTDETEEYCISPDVPLPLHFYIEPAPGRWSEWTLTDAGGF